MGLGKDLLVFVLNSLFCLEQLLDTLNDGVILSLVFSLLNISISRSKGWTWLIGGLKAGLKEGRLDGWLLFDELWFIGVGVFHNLALLGRLRISLLSISL